MTNVKKLYIYNFFAALHLFGGVLMPFFLGWGGLNLTQVMFLQSIFTAGIFMFEMPTGVVADIYGRKNSLLIGALVASLGFFLYSSYSWIVLFVLAELILAAAMTFRSGANEALLYESITDKKQSQSAFARLGSIEMLGVMLGPLLGSFLLAWFSSRQIFMWQAVVMLVVAMIAWTLDSDHPQNSQIPYQNSEKERFWQTLKTGSKLVLARRDLLILALDMSLVATISKMMIYFFQAYLLASGVDAAWLGRLQASAVAIEILAMQAYAWLAQKQSRGSNLVIFWSGLLPALGFFMLGRSLWLTVLGVWITIGFGLSRKPFFKAGFNHHFTDQQRATALSAVSMVSGLISALLNPMFGYLADQDLLATSRMLGVVLILVVTMSAWSRGKQLQ